MRRSKPDQRRAAICTIGAGIILGVLVTLSSVGAGAIGMTALVLLYPGTPIAKLVGSDIAHALLSTLVAGSAIGWLGSVNLFLLLSLLLGSLPGIYLCSHFAARAGCDPAPRPGHNIAAGGRQNVGLTRAELCRGAVYLIEFSLTGIP